MINTTAVYARVIHVVQYFLRNAAHLTVQDLQTYNPSVAQLAAQVRMLSKILGALATASYEDENMAINALQCCLELEKLADVVTAQAEDELEGIFQRLEMHVQAPIV